MSQSSDENSPTTADRNDASTDESISMLRSNVQDPASIIEQVAFTSPTGKSFTILRTSEMNPYEEGAQAGRERFAAMSAALTVTVGDDYRGSDRMAAKLSAPGADIEEFDDLEDLLASLPSIEEMVAHEPPITLGPDSRRVHPEKRNVRVRAFLYAAKREKDNDFHLIVGRRANAAPKMFMTMEISGLPDTANPHYEESGLPDPSAPSYKRTVKKIERARKAFKDYFGPEVPKLGYDFYPHLPILIEGALFFDMTHSSGQRPGPEKLRPDMPTIWELHPVTGLVFEE
ncbi:MAG TPA: hypothetical protein VF723_12420 [Pyrinomonadaceae bacterium]|jgi:hypothetical protein